MSHSTKLAVGGGGGGTLDKLTGNVGLPAVPDGAQNINIVGVGTIQTIVDPMAPNTVQITSSEATATFDCDAGSASPALGIVQVIGTAQEIETLGFGNTIQIGLPANINIANTLTVGTDITAFGSIIATNDIDSTLGSFHAPFGDLVVGGSVQGADLQIAGMATIGGPLSLSWFLRGFLYVDDTGVVHTSEGQNGQVLIGNTDGPSEWRTLTTGYGVQIIDGPNSIILSTSDAIARNYNTDAGTAVPDANILSILGGTNIETSAAGSVVTVQTKADVIFDTVGATTVTITDLVQAARATIIGVVNAGTIVTTSVNASDFVICDHLNTAADATIGQDLSVGRFINVASDATIGGDLLVQEDASIAGELRLSSHTNGVLITDATGFIDASNGSPAGTNGQVLISGGVRPVWNSLESADGSVLITYPAANRINLKVASVNDTVAFKMRMPGEVSWAANNVETEYLFGNKQAMNIILDTHGACYQGDGASAPAYFQSPYNGYMQFNAVIGIKNTAYWEIKNAVMYLYNLTDGLSYQVNRTYLASPFNGAGMMVDPLVATLSLSCFQHVTLASRWAIKVYLHARNDAISQHFTIGTVLSTTPGTYYVNCEFSGFLAYKI
jgi:hypothetical protein